ncbi:hypothetical protein QTP88_017053 [Uroleucon formosanum]
MQQSKLSHRGFAEIHFANKKFMARKMKIPPRTMSRIIKENLSLGAYRRSTDEKIFTVEEKFNRQNDRVYAHNSREATEKIQRVERGHHLASVMVWWRVSYEGKNWTFQQDSAPAHKAEITQRWLETLEYFRVFYACSKPHQNIEPLKADLVKSAASISLEVVRAVIDKWPDRLKKCLDANGGHFE